MKTQNPYAAGAVARHYIIRGATNVPSAILVDGDRYTCVRPWGRLELLCLEAERRHFRVIRCEGRCPDLGDLTGWTLYLDPSLPVQHAATARLTA